VHWRPLHQHPYYESAFGWTEADLPAASAVWWRLVSLPLFSAMTAAQVEAVVSAVRTVCEQHRVATVAALASV
jgi:perosamine synthetase